MNAETEKTTCNCNMKKQQQNSMQRHKNNIPYMDIERRKREDTLNCNTKTPPGIDKYEAMAMNAATPMHNPVHYNTNTPSRGQGDRGSSIRGSPLTGDYRADRYECLHNSGNSSNNNTHVGLHTRTKSNTK